MDRKIRQTTLVQTTDENGAYTKNKVQYPEIRVYQGEPAEVHIDSGFHKMVTAKVESAEHGTVYVRIGRNRVS